MHCFKYGRMDVVTNGQRKAVLCMIWHQSRPLLILVINPHFYIPYNHLQPRAEPPASQPVLDAANLIRLGSPMALVWHTCAFSTRSRGCGWKIGCGLAARDSPRGSVERRPYWWPLDDPACWVCISIIIVKHHHARSLGGCLSVVLHCEICRPVIGSVVVSGLRLGPGLWIGWCVCVWRWMMGGRVGKVRYWYISSRTSVCMYVCMRFWEGLHLVWSATTPSLPPLSSSPSAPSCCFILFDPFLSISFHFPSWMFLLFLNISICHWVFYSNLGLLGLALWYHDTCLIVTDHTLRYQRLIL